MVTELCSCTELVLILNWHYTGSSTSDFSTTASLFWSNTLQIYGLFEADVQNSNIIFEWLHLMHWYPVTPIQFHKLILCCYHIFSNLVWPLISADGHFFEIWTIFWPLISNAGKVLGIFDFALVRIDFSKQEKNKIC